MKTKIIITFLLSVSFFGCSYSEKLSKQDIAAHRKLLDNDSEGHMLGRILRFVGVTDLETMLNVSEHFNKTAKKVLPHVSVDLLNKAFDEEKKELENSKELNFLNLYFKAENFGVFVPEQRFDISKETYSNDAIIKAYILSLQTQIEHIERKFRDFFTVALLVKEKETGGWDFLRSIFEWSKKCNFFKTEQSAKKMIDCLLLYPSKDRAYILNAAALEGLEYVVRCMIENAEYMDEIAQRDKEQILFNVAHGNVPTSIRMLFENKDFIGDIKDSFKEMITYEVLRHGLEDLAIMMIRDQFKSVVWFGEWGKYLVYAARKDLEKVVKGLLCLPHDLNDEHGFCKSYLLAAFERASNKTIKKMIEEKIKSL